MKYLSLEDGALEILPHIGFFITEQIKAVGAQIIESVIAFNARTVPTVAYGLGWEPLKGEDMWEQAVEDDVKLTAIDMGLL